MSQTATAYTIKDDTLNLTLAILDISSLHVHEEIVPALLQHLTRSITEDGYIKDPVIVDEKSLVVLDGVHRIAALKKLGIPRIPACLVDYKNSDIKVSNWYRTITNASNTEATMGNLRLPGVTVEITQKSNLGNIGASPNVAAIKSRKTTVLIKSRFSNIREAFNIIEKIENKLRVRGLTIKYETERDALRNLREGNVDAVICTPKLTKQKIVNAALLGTVLSPKTTRHVIPSRPMRINVPISLLKDDKKPLSEVNVELRNMLLKKHLRTLPPGTVLDGRRYEEELHVFE